MVIIQRLLNVVLVTVRYIFDEHRQLSPAGITLLKVSRTCFSRRFKLNVMQAAMVSNLVLAALCVHLGLDVHIQHVKDPIPASVKSYRTRLRALQDSEYKLAEKEQRSPGQYWLEAEPPKVGDQCRTFINKLMLGSGAFRYHGIDCWSTLHL